MKDYGDRLEFGFGLSELLDAEEPADFDWEWFQLVALEEGEDSNEILQAPLGGQIEGMF